MKIETKLPKNKQRVETGVLQINDDWKGFFIRGDDCMMLKIELGLLLPEVKEHYKKNFLSYLLTELEKVIEK